MKYVEMRKEFDIEGVGFEINISNTGDVNFHPVSGMTEKGSLPFHFLFEDDPIFSDINLFRNPIKIFLTVGDVILDWVKIKKPYTFAFHSSTNRKNKVYGYFAKKLVKKLPNYNMVEHPIGTFRFYRIDD